MKKSIESVLKRKNKRFPLFGKQAVALCLSIWATGGCFAGESGPRIQNVRVFSTRANPSGIGVGFWANYSCSRQVVEKFGLRPLEREGFSTWRSIEKSPGVYTWTGRLESEKNAHRAGATVITSVNMMFTKQMNKDGMDAIPSFYVQDIRDPATRAAAKRFLAAFVENALNELGTVVLVPDYEFLWFVLPRTPELRETYRDWFVEAAGVCRETAKKMGRSGDLKVACIFNTNPLETSKGLIGGGNPPGHVPQQWIKDVVAASDIAAIDSYAQDRTAPTSAGTFFDVVKFWVENYVHNKTIYITENGFSSCEEHGKTPPGYHARGTEAEQAEYFKNVFSTLQHKGEAGYAFLANVKGYCIWMYRDSSEKGDPVECYFGVVRADGSPKPACKSIQDGIGALEKSRLSPWLGQPPRNVTVMLNSGLGVDLNYTDGFEHDFLEIALNAPAAGQNTVVEFHFDCPVSLVAELPGGVWKTITDEKKLQTLSIDNLPAGTSVVRIFATASRFPVRTKLEQVVLKNP